MKKLKRLLKRIFLFTLLAILLIVIYNTIRFSSKQIKVEEIPQVAVDAGASGRLAAAVQIPTVSYHTHIDTAAFVQFHQYLDQTFPSVKKELKKTSINDYSLVYKWAGKKSILKPILYMAHIDVVPIEKNSREAWTDEPFSGAIKEGYIYGRGVLDDKFSLIGILEAIEQLIKEGYRPERTIYLAFGHDEEVGGRNGAKAIAQHFKKKHIEFEYILDEGSLIMENAMPGMDNPIGLIGIAEKGAVTLHLTSNTSGGHSSMPPQQTAIGVLSKAIAKLEAHPMPASFDGPTGKLLDYAGPETNILMRAVLSNRWLFGGLLKKQFSKKPTTNATIRTTTAVTLINGGIQNNVLPTQASATINFRIRPGDTIEDVENYVKKMVNDDRISIKTDQNSRNSSKISDDKAFGFQVIQRTLQETFPDVVVAPSLVVGGTDSRHYQAVTENTYRLMPVQVNAKELEGFHGINERLSEKNYHQAIRFYYRLIKNSAG